MHGDVREEPRPVATPGNRHGWHPFVDILSRASELGRIEAGSPVIATTHERKAPGMTTARDNKDRSGHVFVQPNRNVCGIDNHAMRNPGSGSPGNWKSSSCRMSGIHEFTGLMGVPDQLAER